MGACATNGWHCPHPSCRFFNEDDELPFCQMCARIRSRLVQHSSGESRPTGPGREDGSSVQPAAGQETPVQRQRHRAAYEARAVSRAELSGVPRRPAPRLNARRPTPLPDDEWEKIKAEAKAKAEAAAAAVAEEQAREAQRSAPRGNACDAGNESADADERSRGDSSGEEEYQQQLKSRARAYRAGQAEREAQAPAEAGRPSRRPNESPPTTARRATAHHTTALQWDRAEAAWAKFAARGQEICMRDVPWPSLDAASLRLGPRQSEAERKSAYRTLSLRWHPDRFVQAFGAKLRADEREGILQKVTEVSQTINAMFRDHL
ncbi:hypothetical protein EMIHUDRAFT_115394 [Emiliania huxleyi CCMP1516]|uniref:J domain-containing protein n=2 Tax=Emiliania huxleyi TaxID=2903 RepID=A0A0D3JPZ6_EMIH1|nr:hypothetical protein EMIHUDRAFT_115394 [Emiliania huxleyi CCMP1516]EOD25581.1 hypothetical protein EMIHUDRAFT_115394 [Emiliania huxleyi CCMP1516]|eukprot:XP_005778010.1 hypothetical protein EMIHUDRAFT_115394 [Emiliania huxleyi CCMP1516]